MSLMELERLSGDLLWETAPTKLRSPHYDLGWEETVSLPMVFHPSSTCLGEQSGHYWRSCAGGRFCR
jgi:hypothetical protein